MDESNGITVYSSWLQTEFRKPIRMPHQMTDVIIARALFLTNCIRGSKGLGSFNIVRGYRPSVSGIPAPMVTQEMTYAYISHEATSALNRMLVSRKPNELTESVIPPGTNILVYFKMSKQNDPVRWVNAKVVKATDQAVICRRSERGAPMTVAYGDKRIKPGNELARQLALIDVQEEYTGINVEENEPIEPNTIGTLMNAATDNSIKEIGINPDERQPTKPVDLKTDEKEVLKLIKNTIGSEQVTRRRLKGIPAWIVQKALKKEHEGNRLEAYEEVIENKVRKVENIIASHAVYKLKVDESGGMPLKAWILPHGNRDQMNDDVRKDSSTAQFDVIRILLSMATEVGVVLGHVDIKGAYRQSGPIQRTIYVRPPRELGLKRGILWKLTRLPYGIIEAGRQWAMVFEKWLISNAAMERVTGVDQLFVKRNIDGTILMMMAEVTDDLLIVGSRLYIESFVKKLEKRFPISKAVLDVPIRFNGCMIKQDSRGDISMSMS